MTDGIIQPRTVNSAIELLQEVTVAIVGVTFYRVSAEIRDGLDEDNPDIGDVVPTYALKLLAENEQIGVRLALKLEAGIGVIEVDAAINYVTPEPVILGPGVHLEFANEVGIMALIPFLRESVWSMSQRVFGQAIVMPVFQRGELSFSPDEEDAAPLTQR